MAVQIFCAFIFNQRRFWLKEKQTRVTLSFLFCYFGILWDFLPYVTLQPGFLPLMQYNLEMKCSSHHASQARHRFLKIYLNSSSFVIDDCSYLAIGLLLRNTF